MIFSSLQYLIFLPIVVLLYWRISPSAFGGSARRALVIFASYFFYMSWVPVYGILLFFLTLFNWLFGLAIAAHQEQKRKQALLIGGLVLNLGCLGYYKYTNFLLQSIATALSGLNNFGGHLSSAFRVPIWDVTVLQIALPLGISFFVFEFVHYLVDVYRGSKPITSFTEFAAFASFFPSQIAGPIKRYQDFIVKLESPERLSKPLFFEAMTLIVRGLFKKVVIADPLGSIITIPLSTLTPISSFDAFTAAVGFAIQVFCDFSGYTDIGRGSALLLGIRLPENFNLPYLAKDLADFWRRWHMSLSYWLRDYVYIPLGGSHGSTLVNYRNLLVTMMLCGLWHGADWRFILFGALQGAGLIINREWKHVLSKIKGIDSVLSTPIGTVCSITFNMAFIVLTWLLIRTDITHAWNVISNLFNFKADSLTWQPVFTSGIIQFMSVYVLFWLAEETLKRRPEFFSAIANGSQFSTPIRFASWTAATLLMLAAKPVTAVPFVYFQF
jgi:D-alanyl-lipoteichoic acid acyltransferase DltB (MBOAT superfamily)